MNPYVVIDIGGTSIKYGLADAEGQLIETMKCQQRPKKEDLTFLRQRKKS